MEQKIELLLAFRDLWEVVFETPPANLAADLEAASAFQKKDAKAKVVIGQTLNDEHLEHVRSVQTASEMWTCLKDVFQKNSLLNKLAIRRRFYTTDMIEDESMLTYINGVRQISDELKSMDVNIDETEVAMAVLNGLPPKYDHLIVALDALVDDTKLTMELTKSRLLQEEQRKTERSVHQETVVKSEHAVALFGNSKQKRLGGSSEVRTEYICYRCKQTRPYCTLLLFQAEFWSRWTAQIG
jgi:gag-polypeptide of LTR copia-type